MTLRSMPLLKLVRPRDVPVIHARNVIRLERDVFDAILDERRLCLRFVLIVLVRNLHLVALVVRVEIAAS